jgi:hypothetical protein
MACPRKDKTKRVSLDLLLHEVTDFAKVQKDCKILTLIDTVRRAMKLLGFVTRQLADGSELILRRPDKTEEKIHLL